MALERPKSAKRANRCISPAGSPSMAASPRAHAWCRICRPPAPRSRSTIPTRCRPGCGWRFRAMPGPGGTAKWSGAAASRSASSSSASAGTTARAIKGGMRKSLLAIVCLVLPGFRMAARRATPCLRSRQDRDSRQAAAAEARDIRQFMRGVWCGLRQDRGHRHLREGRRRRQHRRRRSRLALEPHVIGGAMNCTNPGRSEICANQRSRFGSFGLVTPSTPNQRRA